MSLPDTEPLSAAAYDDLLAQQDWASLSKRLTAFAFRKLGKTSPADAEDAAQAAIRQVFDPRYQRWSPRKQPDLFLFLGSLVNGILSNQRRLKRTKVETLYEQEDLEELAPGAIDLTDEQLAKRLTRHPHPA